MDMHSGGGTKEDPYEMIYIEASEEEARVIFYNRFGHDPERVTCTCCGSDYSISSHESIAQLTGFDRNCKYGDMNEYVEEQCERLKKYTDGGDDGWRAYLEQYPDRKYVTLEEYFSKPWVLAIHAEEIKTEERKGEVHRSGYVWID